MIDFSRTLTNPWAGGLLFGLAGAVALGGLTAIELVVDRKCPICRKRFHQRLPASDGICESCVDRRRSRWRR